MFLWFPVARRSDDVFFTEVFSFDDDVGHNHVRSEGLGVRRKVFRGSCPHIPAVPLFPPCFPEPRAVVSHALQDTLFFQFQDLLLYPIDSDS